MATHGLDWLTDPNYAKKRKDAISKIPGLHEAATEASIQQYTSPGSMVFDGETGQYYYDPGAFNWNKTSDPALYDNYVDKALEDPGKWVASNLNWGGLGHGGDFSYLDNQIKYLKDNKYDLSTLDKGAYDRYNVTKQILAQGTTGKWTGEGFGGPVENAKVMAGLLTGAGITDIKDFGRTKIPQTSAKMVYPNYRYEGEMAIPTGTYYTYDQSGEPVSVDPAKVYENASYWDPDTNTAYGRNYFIDEVTYRDGWGNKRTGQEIYQNYNRVGGDVWQGTYTGHGRTNFGVQFAPDGTPYFYTQFGGDTSSMGDIVPIVALGLAVFAPGIGTAIGSALGATGVAASVVGNAIVQGVLAEAGGGNFVDGAIKGAVSGGIAPAVAGTIGSAVADAMTDVALKNVVASAVSSSVSSAIVAGVTGQDIGAAALSGAVMGAAGAAGQDLGTAAQYGTDAFSEQTQALAAQDRGMGLTGGSAGQIVGSAVGSIALGTPEDKALFNALTKTVSQGLSSLPSLTGTSQTGTDTADSGEGDSQVADSLSANDLKSLIVDSTSQVASAGDTAVDLAEIERLRNASNIASDASDKVANYLTSSGVDDSEDPLLGLSSAIVGEGEQAAIDNAAGDKSEEKTSTDIETGAGAETPQFQGPMGPVTEDIAKRYKDEFSKYLDYQQAGEPPPPDYKPPPFNEPGPYWDEFNQNLQTMIDEGRLPSQWQQDEEGNYTYVDDDGSTLTIDQGGNIVHHTEAPEGNLPGEGLDATASESSTANPRTNLITTTTAAGPRPTTLKPDLKTAVAGLAGAGLSPTIASDTSTAVKPAISPLSISSEKTGETWTGGTGKTSQFINPLSSGEVRVDPIPDVIKRQEGNLPGDTDPAQRMLKSKYPGESDSEDSDTQEEEGNLMDYYSYGSPSEPGEVLKSFSQFARGGRAMASPLQAATGGVPHKGSHYVQGEGGGQDDLIDARLADGEYVFDADIVAALGDGSNKRGAEILDKFRAQIRKHKRSAPKDKIPPAAKSPLAYLKEVTS